MALYITQQDGFPIGLAAVDDDPLGPAVPFECLGQEALGRSQVAPLTEPEFHCVTVAVDGTVQVHPPSSDLDVSFVDVPSAGDWALAPIELLQQKWGIVNGPAMNGSVIDGDAALSHHLLQVPQAQFVSQVPADAQQDHRAIKMTAFEHRTSPDLARDVDGTQLRKSLRRSPVQTSALAALAVLRRTSQMCHEATFPNSGSNFAEGCLR